MSPERDWRSWFSKLGADLTLHDSKDFQYLAGYWWNRIRRDDGDPEDVNSASHHNMRYSSFSSYFAMGWHDAEGDDKEL